MYGFYIIREDMGRFVVINQQVFPGVLCYQLFFVFFTKRFPERAQNKVLFYPESGHFYALFTFLKPGSEYVVLKKRIRHIIAVHNGENDEKQRFRLVGKGRSHRE